MMNMISESCMDAYREMYPHDSICYGEPGDSLFIESGSICVEQPFEETDETFMARLSKCTPENNLFLQEWPEAEEIDPDIDR